MLRALAPLLLLLPLPASAADLVLVSLTAPDRAVEGATYTFDVELRNDGLDAIGDVGVVARVSSDAVFQASDDLICSRTAANGLASGATIRTTVSCPWPLGLVGPRYLVVRLDGPLLQELDWSDNDGSKAVFVVPADAPDLVGRLEPAVDEVRAGETYAPHVRVENRGDTDVPAGTLARLYLSADTTLGGDTQLCSLTLPLVPANDRVEVDLAGCGVPRTATVGTSGALVLWVDATLSIQELDEGNNVVITPVEVLPPLPDLRFTQLVAPPSVVSGVAFEIDVTVLNDGFVDVAGTTVSVRASADEVYDDTDPLVCSGPLSPGPAAGQSAFVQLTGCAVPTSVTPSGMRLVARVDPTRTIEERVESNNDTARQIVVTARRANLGFVAFAPPPTASHGLAFSIPYTLGNTGLVDVPTTSVAVRLSTDADYDASDLLLCSAVVAGPAAGGSATGTLQGCVAPAGTPTGPAFVVARVDASVAVAESDETDNDVSAEIEVIDPRPDWRVVSVTPWGTRHIGWWISADVVVANDGRLASPGTSWTVFLSQDDVFDAGDRALCSSNSVSSIPAGSQITMNGVGCELPSRMRPGTWWAFVAIDPNDTFDELDETDNVLGQPIEVEPLPGDSAVDTAETDPPADTDESDVPADTDDTDVVVDTDETDAPVDTDAVDTDVDSDPIDTDRDDDDRAPPRWFCATGGGAPSALWTVGLLALALRRRRQSQGATNASS